MKLPLAVKGHTFEKVEENIFKVDGGVFVYEEALELVRMLNSPNPITRLNANLIIWERNGLLRLVAVGLIIIVILLVIILARR